MGKLVSPYRKVMCSDGGAAGTLIANRDGFMHGEPSSGDGATAFAAGDGTTIGAATPGTGVQGGGFGNVHPGFCSTVPSPEFATNSRAAADTAIAATTVRVPVEDIVRLSL